MKVRYSRPGKVEDYINKWVNTLPWGKKLKEQLPILYWKQIAGEEIAKQTEPLRVENGILFVRVNDVLWKRELIMHTGELLTRYRKIGFQLKGIRFMGGV